MSGQSGPANLYYVSTTGQDASSGGTLDKPWASIAYALSQAPEGSTIYLREGSYSGDLTITKQGITLESYPGETARISASNTDPSVEVAVRIGVDAHHTTLRNLDIRGGFYYAVKTETSWGSDTGGIPNYGPQHLSIDSCKLHDSGRDVVKLTSGTDYAKIVESEVYGSGRRDGSNAEGVDAVNVKQFVFQHNHIHDIATTGIYVKGGSVGALIENNVIENVGHGGIGLGQVTDLEWFDAAANPQFFESIDAIARNNLIINSESAGITSQGSLRSTIYSNTLVNVAKTYQAGIVVQGSEHALSPNYTSVQDRPDQDAKLYDNIVIVSSTRPVFAVRDVGGGALGKLTLDSNLYYSTAQSAVFSDELSGYWTGGISAWKTHTGLDASSLEANPKLDANYQLTASSPTKTMGYSMQPAVGGSVSPVGLPEDNTSSDLTGEASQPSTPPPETDSPTPSTNPPLATNPPPTTTPPANAGYDVITVKVSGDHYKGAPNFVIAVESETIDSSNIVTAVHNKGQWQTFTFKGEFGTDPNKVSITFNNDAWGGTASTDRNLYVDEVSLNGKVNGADATYKWNETKHWAFGSGSSVLSNDDVITVRVSGDHYEGAPNFALILDGKTIDASNAVTAVHPKGEWQEFTFKGNFDDAGLDPHKVGIRFDNDTWGGTTSTDRNLYVDNVIFNGAVNDTDAVFMWNGTKVWDFNI